MILCHLFEGIYWHLDLGVGGLGPIQVTEIREFGV